MLCVIYDGVAVPILWQDLAKKGASSLPERKALLDRALARYDLRGMCLLADWEYVGVAWFNYLHANGLDFCIRSRDYAYFRDVEAGGNLLPVLLGQVGFRQNGKRGTAGSPTQILLRVPTAFG